MSRIFLSHSSLDVRQAIALKQWLAERDHRLGREIFLDVDTDTGIQAGTRWKNELISAMTRCEAVICLLSRNWEASTECRAEYRHAESLGKQIFVARLEEDTGTDITSEWQRCDLFGDTVTTSVDIGDAGERVVFADAGLYPLLNGIAGTRIGPENFAWPPPDEPDRAPYRGWQPFEEMDAAVFFGRDAEMVRGLDLLRTMRLGVGGVKSLFVVLGPSGTGKSSFLRAGMVPRLRREDERFVPLEIVRPERDPLTGENGLAACIHAARQHYGLSTPTLGEIKKACTGGADGVVALLDEVAEAADRRLRDRGHAGDPPTLVLAVDQAEELFSADSGAQADRFLELIAELTATLDLVVAATIRTDRYEVMQTHPALAGVETVLFDELRPMPATQFKEVITGPATRATDSGRPLRISPDLVDRLLDDAADGADTLPLLSLALARLYADYGSAGELTVSHYDEMGGIRHIVDREIDSVLSRDPALRHEQLELLRSAFIPWLATVNPDNDQPMRRVARYADLPEASRPLIDALVDKRLMVSDRRDGELVVEVALESLLRQWDDLAGWLREQREDLKDADNLERAASAWQRSGRDDAWLLQGTRLADAEKLAASAGFSERLTPTREFVSTSQQRENERAEAERQRQEAELRSAREHAAALRRRARVLRAVLAVAVVVAVVAVVGFVQASAARREADRQNRAATVQRLVSESRLLLDGTIPGGDVRALQEILIARNLAAVPDDGMLYNTVVRRDNLAKVLDIDGRPAVRDAVFSDDRNYIASADDGGHVRVFELKSGQQVHDFTSPKRSVIALAISPDGRRVAGGSDNTLRVWDVDTGQEAFTVGVPTPGDLAFSADGRYVTCACKDGSARSWDAGGTQVRHVQITDQPRAMALSAHGDWATAVGADRQVSVFNVPAGTRRARAEFKPDRTPRLALSDDGSRLAIADVANVAVFNLAERGEARVVSLDQHSGVSALAISADGRHVATAGIDNKIVNWDTSTGAIANVLPGHQAPITTLAFSEDTTLLVSASRDGELKAWNARPTRLEVGVQALSVATDEARIVVGGDDGAVHLYDAYTGTRLGRLAGHEYAVLSVAVSRDGGHLASAASDGIRLWDVESGRQLRAMTPPGGAVESVAFDPSGRYLASAGEDAKIRIWDTETGAMLRDMSARRDEGPQDLNRLLTVAYSPDGRHVAAGGVDQTARIWEADTGRQLHNFRVDSIVMSVAFNPGGDLLAVGARDNSVRLWNATSGELVRTLAGHQGAVTGVAFRPDGSKIATTGEDGALRLWDTGTGRPFGDPQLLSSGRLAGLAMSRTGLHVVTAGSDRSVAITLADATPAALCEMLASNMSTAQWREWVSSSIDYVDACPGLPRAQDADG